jgi:hypothetical protein
MENQMFRPTSIANCVIAGILLLACVAAPPSVSAQQPTQPEPQEGFGERLGEQLDKGIQRLTEEVREGWASLRNSVDQFGVQARVYSRLRWDKNLAGADLTVDVEEEGVVVVSGRVSSEQAKQKALELARDTVGVKRAIVRLAVTDQLSRAPEAAEK